MIEAKFKEEYDKRYNELKEHGLLVGDQLEIEFEMGHHYEFNPNAKSETGRKVEHRCTPFVRIKN